MTASLDAAVFAAGTPAAGVRLLGTTAASPDGDGIARFRNLALSAWPNGTGQIRLLFSSTYAVRGAAAAATVAAVPLAGSTEPFVVLPTPVVIVPIVSRALLSPYIVAAIFFGAAIAVGAVAAAALRAARARATRTTTAAAAAAATAIIRSHGDECITVAVPPGSDGSVTATIDAVSYRPTHCRFSRGTRPVDDDCACDGSARNGSSSSRGPAGAAVAPAAAPPAAHTAAPSHRAAGGAHAATVVPVCTIQPPVPFAAVGPATLDALRNLDAALCSVEGREPSAPAQNRRGSHR